MVDAAQPKQGKTAGRSMNWNRGLWRIWLVVASVWVAGTVWALWSEISFPCENPEIQKKEVIGCTYDKYYPANSTAWLYRQRAAEIALGPPLGLLILGYACAWIMSGFRRDNS
jgi:hypothetical protein